MPDAVPLILPPVLAVQDEARIHPVKRKKSRSGVALGVAIGAILLLSDGSKCEVVGYDKNGKPICLPLED